MANRSAKGLRSIGLGGGVALAYVLALGATSAQAQTSSETPPARTAETESDSGELVVTAQRRSERLQDVPISISALGAEELSDRGVDDVTALRGVAPGVSISHSAGVNASNLVAMRGVSGLPQPIGTSLATGVYLDGVYLSRPDAAVFALDDIERIEILRGPQGTLYGRNTTAGAINIITRLPGDTVEGGLDVSAGNFNSFSARGSLSGPLGGNFSGGLSGGYRSHDGYITNTVTGHELNAVEDHTLRGVLRYLSDGGNFDARLSVDESVSTGQDVFKNVYAFPAATLLGPGNPEEVSLDANSESLTAREVTSRGVALTVTYSPTTQLELTSITSVRELQSDTSFDVDSSPIPLLVSSIRNSSDTFNQEVHAVWDLGRFRLTTGANYYHEEAEVGFGSNSGAATTLNYTNPHDTTTLDAYALFGQAEWDFTDRLTLVLGARYNEEHRDYTVDYTQAPVPGIVTSGSITDSIVIPSLGLNFELTPDVLLYAKYSEGYQAPGFNGFPGRLVPPNTFDAENLDAFELGIKSQFFDRALTFNAAAFHYEYSDLQVRGTPGPGLTDIRNAAGATIDGVEASVVLRANEYLSFTGNLTYLDARYDEFCELIGGGSPVGADPLCDATHADRSGNRLSLAPEWTGGVNANLEVPMGSITLRGNLGYSFETNSFFTSVNEDVLSTGGWERIDARLGVGFADGLEVYAFGRNLSDDRYTGYGLRALPNLAPVTFNDPRTYGVGIRYHF